MYLRGILEDCDRAKAAFQCSLPIKPLVMDHTKRAIAAFDFRNYEELVTLTHVCCNNLGIWLFNWQDRRE